MSDSWWIDRVEKGIGGTEDLFGLLKFETHGIYGVRYHGTDYNRSGERIGGFEAFSALCEMRKAREKYPAFRIPMVCLPATISNNVPGTDFSLGSDTCLNSLIEYCDTIKQSASASRRRVFVVETQVHLII